MYDLATLPEVESGSRSRCVAVRVSYPLTATEITRSRSEFPNWHYFVCNLLILKGVGLSLVCIVKWYICLAGSKALPSEQVLVLSRVFGGIIIHLAG